jgi:hypothetical protein
MAPNARSRSPERRLGREPQIQPGRRASALVRIPDRSRTSREVRAGISYRNGECCQKVDLARVRRHSTNDNALDHGCGYTEAIRVF